MAGTATSAGGSSRSKSRASTTPLDSSAQFATALLSAAASCGVVTSAAEGTRAPPVPLYGPPSDGRYGIAWLLPLRL
ncbi:hypothetical protein IM796_03650 [Streptomyces albidoflavus]|nr:hypothetical protein [Streptomyces albidoflavus]